MSTKVKKEDGVTVGTCVDKIKNSITTIKNVVTEIHGTPCTMVQPFHHWYYGKKERQYFGAHTMGCAI